MKRVKLGWRILCMCYLATGDCCSKRKVIAPPSIQKHNQNSVKPGVKYQYGDIFEICLLLDKSYFRTLKIFARNLFFSLFDFPGIFKFGVTRMYRIPLLKHSPGIFKRFFSTRSTYNSLSQTCSQFSHSRASNRIPKTSLR